ncbi:MAG: permease [Terriglobia bacterium]|nr:MAG: permease [Terriglobia bacterium]
MRQTEAHPGPGLGEALDSLFDLKQRRTTLRTELTAGATTFVAAAYLVVVIPNTLAGGGVDLAAATTATILMFALGTLGMACYARLPFVVGPGIGGAAIIASTLAATERIPWQTGMAVAFWSGVLFLVLTLLGMRQVVVRIVPAPIKTALSPALGLFIVTLGFRNAGLIVANPRANALMLGNFAAPGAILALVGLALVVGLHIRKVPGAILLGILGSTLIGIPLGVTTLPSGIIGLPHSLGTVAFQLNFKAALSPALLPYIFAFFAAEFFSTMGTTLAVAGEAGLLDKDGNMAGINGPFVVDSCAATIGPIFGVPAPTALIESAAGVEAGGRTGLTSVTTACLFLVMLFLGNVILMVPKEATSPALILVGCSMFANLRKIDLAHFSHALPPLLMILITLFANNFGTGIAAGILSYLVVQVLAGKARQVSPGLYLLAIPLLYFFFTLATRK